MTGPHADGPLLSVHEVTRRFPVRRGSVLRRTVGEVVAVDGVSLELRRGEALGVVGESGCGKTTLARLLLGLERPTSGRILLDGRDTATLDSAGWRAARRRMQVVFQDPYSSLDPRHTVGEIVAEPLVVHRLGDPRSRARRVAELLELVGLGAERTRWYPHQLSGGQRQRVGIARALALDPEILVCDEPVSALDVSVQAQVLAVLRRLRRELDLGLVFISHDLAVVRQVCDRVAVMYLGRIVEQAAVDDLYAHPEHPYTQALLSAVPTASALPRRERIILRGDPPSPMDPPSGCHFRSRCWRADDACASRPPLAPLTSTASRMPRAQPTAPDDHVVACHHAGAHAPPSPA